MLYEKIIGNSKDFDLKDRQVDSINIDWFEAFNKIHRKTSELGEDVKIRLSDEILTVGIREGDILYLDDDRALVVKLKPAKAIEAKVKEDHLKSLAKLCYEVGNTHTSMFYGDDPYTYYIPYSSALEQKLEGIHGVTLDVVEMVFDFNNALSNSINNHHH